MAFSAAGKQLFDRDPRSGGIVKTAQLAQKVHPKIAILEITAELYQNDAQHGMFTKTVDAFADAGMRLMSCEVVMDSELGGIQSRRRCLLHFEQVAFCEMLTPIQPLSRQPPKWCIADILEPLADIPDEVWVEGKWCPFPPDSDPQPTLPIMAGELRFGGAGIPLRIGALVRHNSTDKVWRLRAFLSGGGLKLLNPDRRRPYFCEDSVLETDVTHEPQLISVFSIAGVSPPIRTWGEGVEGAS